MDQEILVNRGDTSIICATYTDNVGDPIDITGYQVIFTRLSSKSIHNPPELLIGNTYSNAEKLHFNIIYEKNIIIYK